jgi:hypothetical protein
VASWLRLLEDDPRAIFTAARLAFADHMNRFVAGDRTPSSTARKRRNLLGCAGRPRLILQSIFLFLT